MSTQITTGKVRFSYCNLFTPRAVQEGATPKYSVTLLIPKSDKATMQKIKAAMDEAKQKFMASNSGKKLPTNLKSTLHDGDGERPNGGEFGEECKGCYVITVSSNNKPVLVHADKTPLTDPQELYSGCYGRAIINFYVYDTQGNKGISAGLWAAALLRIPIGTTAGKTRTTTTTSSVKRMLRRVRLGFAEANAARRKEAIREH